MDGMYNTADERMKFIILSMTGERGGITTYDIARVLNISYNGARKIINGARRLTLDKAVPIARIAAERGDERLLNHIRDQYLTIEPNA